VPPGTASDVKTQSNRSHLFVRGLNTSVSGNSQAFGFSITITVTYGLISSAGGKPALPELFGFALSAVAAFSLLNLIVAGMLLKRQSAGEPRRVVLVATATDFLAVGAGIAAAVGIREVVSDWGAWVLGPFCAGVVYVLIQAVELSLGQDQDQDQGEDEDE
jgi:hypothetical protein